MRCLSFALSLALYTLTPIVAAQPAQDATSESIARRQFNQVFVKVIMPVTARTPKQDGPVVESWVAEHLKQLGESEYFAVTNWVPICDGLLEDDEVDNRVWGGSLGNASFCPVGADIPERKDGRVLVSVAGWAPVAGYEVRVTMADETGNRTVEPVLYHSPSGEKKQVRGEKPMAFVAVLIGPPHRERATSHSKDE
ncbi:hypothetical protein [Rubripirellula reticaptiva]|uniref:PrcB C-terminal domain-containing protein n=1 Tax=Rubripirellula reticaptiva TaxID=2528013 RepID=A0A5C6ER60_9BACT|nr:hypothetical protein [Rubripirellula reticaptiva]TWU51418.1 hypothetical protein Poly59_30100 [Rubripirellula reticaptiva]